MSPMKGRKQPFTENLLLLN